MEKEPKEILDQIERLKAIHHLNIDNDEEAINILSSMNYFLIRGYGSQFLINECEKNYIFKEKTTLNQIYDLFLFDNELRALLLSIIGITEKSLRTIISNVISCKRRHCNCSDYDFYPNVGAFKNISKVNRVITNNIIRLKNMYLLDIEQQQINPAYRCKSNNVIYHYFKYHNGKFPLWIILEFISIGDLASIYRNCISDNTNNIEADQIEIANKFNTIPRKLIKFIECINVLRNKCCHFNRIYGTQNLPIPPSIVSNPTQEENRAWSSKPLFSIILVLKHLNLNNKTEWNIFVKRLKNIIKNHQNVLLNVLGFPEDWFDRLIWQCC